MIESKYEGKKVRYKLEMWREEMKRILAFTACLHSIQFSLGLFVVLVL